MLNVIIVEDDPNQANVIRQLVNNRILINPTPHRYDMAINLQTSDPDEAIGKISHDSYLAILDIELASTINGIDVADKIRRTAAFAEIIFVTAYQDYLPYTVSRRIEPLDYIVKSADTASVTKRLRQDIDEAYGRYQSFLQAPPQQQSNFVYEPVRGIKRQVALQDVDYLESIKLKSHRLRLVGKNLRVEFPGTLSKINRQHLVAVSQSCLVNPDNIVEFDKKKRVLYFDRDHQIQCVVSFRKLKEISRLFDSHS